MEWLLVYALVLSAVPSCRSFYVSVGNFLDVDGSSITVTITNLGDSSVNVSFAEVSFASYSRNASIPPDGQVLPVFRCWSIVAEVDKTGMKVLIENELSVSPNATDLSVYNITVYGSITKPQYWVNEIIDPETTQTEPLHIDQAYFIVTSYETETIEYSKTVTDCYKCKANVEGVLYPGEIDYIVVSSQFEATYFFNYSTNNTGVCSPPVSKHFGEHSHYSMVIQDGHCSSLEELVPGKNSYLPILYAFLIIAAVWLSCAGGTALYRWSKRRGMFHWRKVDRNYSKDMGDPKQIWPEGKGAEKTETSALLPNREQAINRQDTPGVQGAQHPVQKKKRLMSLDTFRGLSLTIMIFVNYGGGGYWFFNHSTWNGITVADLVFPWFVWIMGVSLVFSFKGRKQDSFWAQLYQIIRRTTILMGLGLFLNNGFSLSNWRIPGVLQRLAVSYFAVALTELLTSRLYSRLQARPFLGGVVSDLTNNWIQWIIVALLEMTWLFVTFFMSPPNCPPGYLGPGGLADYGRFMDRNCTGGAAGYIDRWLFQPQHIYQSPTCKKVYQTGPFDPEGVLGSINSIIICFLGVQAGRILVYHGSHVQRLLRFIIWGLALGAVAIALCGASQNEGVIPLNKNLWSLSFILLMASMAFVLLAVCYVLVDVFHVWTGTPFRYPGMNSIMVYVGSELLYGFFPFGWKGMRDSHLEYLASNLISISLWLLIAFYWYSIDFFVKI